MSKFLKRLSIILLVMLVAAGCGSNPEPASQETTSAKGVDNEPLKVSITGGAAGAIWSIMGEGIGETLKRSYPGTTFSYIPGQDGANIVTVTTGQAEFGLVSAPSAKLAVEGKHPYPEKNDKVRTVAFLHSMPYHFVVSEDSGITSIEQIVDEKLPYVAAVNTKDSPMEIASQYVFKSYDTSYEKIESNGGKMQFISLNKGYELMKDNKMDGVMSPLPLPTGGLLEMHTTKPLKLLPLSDAAIKSLEDNLGGKPFTIKPGIYPFVTEDVPTVSLDTLLVTSSDVSEETVYKVVKAMYEQMDYLHTVHKALGELTPETIADVSGAPLHPGAEKFYKEVGILK